MRKTLLALAFVTLVAVGQANAQIDVTTSYWGFTSSTATLPVSNCPRGDFETILAAGAGTGSIYVFLQDVSGLPILGLPPTDVIWQACGGSGALCWCPGSVQMDAPTIPAGAFGWAQATGTLQVGGCALTGIECWVYDPVLLVWVLIPLTTVCEPNIIFKSPDLNADCRINLSDLAIFGNSYGKSVGSPGYNACADYNDDNQVNLSDFAFFSAHYVHTC